MSATDAKPGKTIRLGDLIQHHRPITYGVVQPGDPDPNGIVLVRGRDYSNGWKPAAELLRISPEVERSFSRARLLPGDIVITIKGDVGTAALVPDWLEGANISQTNARLAIDGSKADARYVLAFLQSAEGRRAVYRATQTGAQPGLIFEDIANFNLRLPPLKQQRRIADALATWDRTIATAEALVSAKRKLYHAARQRLIDNRQRTAGSDDGWRNIEFGELAEELGDRNRGRLGASSVMGVLKSQGIVPMRENAMASDLDRYLVVPPGAFAYNPMRLNIGSIAQSNHPSDVLVSPDYVVFTARAGKGSAAFLRHFIGSKRWRDTMELAASGSVRLRIYFGGLAEMALRAPSLYQQEHIAKVLDAAQTEIAIASKKLESLRAQKRGLMQKLLTGEWRLPANASEQAA
jgi:type I restriction enzyme, S subunit